MSDLDIRLKASFKDHRKRKKLAARLGPAGVLALIDLWLTAAETHPSGILAGYTSEDIEIDAGWSGPGGAFSAALVVCGFLDETPEGFALHDWPDHQGWLTHAEERSACAKRAAAIRWASGQDTERMRGACGGHAEGNAPSPIPSPSPIPTPNPIPEGRGAAAPPVDFQIRPECGPAEVLAAVRNLRPEYANLNESVWLTIWKTAPAGSEAIRATAIGEAMATLAGKIETDTDPLRLIKGYVRNALANRPPPPRKVYAPDEEIPADA